MLLPRVISLYGGVRLFMRHKACVACKLYVHVFDVVQQGTTADNGAYQNFNDGSQAGADWVQSLDCCCHFHSEAGGCDQIARPSRLVLYACASD